MLGVDERSVISRIPPESEQHTMFGERIIHHESLEREFME